MFKKQSYLCCWGTKPLNLQPKRGYHIVYIAKKRNLVLKENWRLKHVSYGKFNTLIHLGLLSFNISASKSQVALNRLIY